MNPTSPPTTAAEAKLGPRPVEPHHAGENPEAWAEIAQWESDRADIAEHTIAALTDAIKDALGESEAGQWTTIKDRFSEATISKLRAALAQAEGRRK